jgi:predicted histone-like DNA-binding protein
MAKYIKQEMPDIAGKGEHQVYYRMQTERNIGAAEFVEEVAGLGTGLSEGAVTHVLEQMVQTMARLLADGHTVTIGRLGTFRTAIGVMEGKEQDTFDADEPKRNAQSIEVKGVNFRADKALVKDIRVQCRLERGKESRLHRSPYTREERLARALAFMEEHTALRVPDYVRLTGLSRTTASLELRELCQDTTSGIRSMGQRASKVYVKR